MSRELFAVLLKSSRDKLAPTGAIAASCMGCLPAWTVKSAICRISAQHNPCRSELARELFAVLLKSSRDKLAPTGAIAASCMGCLPAWTVKSAISRISALHNPCRSELARELFAAWLKSSRDKLAPTDAVATSCMGCLPAWTVKSAICRISAQHNPCRSELARELLGLG